MNVFKDLPTDIIDLIFDYIDDIDTRRRLGLKPRRIKIQDSFVKMFDKLPKPLITNHGATLSLGSMRPTYYDEDVPSFHPTYLIIRIAEGGVYWDEYYIENVQYMRSFDTPPSNLTRYLENICMSPKEEKWLYNDWDGEKETYDKYSYKACLNIRQQRLY